MSKTDSLNRRIFRLGVPSMVASISVPLIGIVDTALVGHLPNVASLGAVSVGSVILDVLYWGLGFLRMGTTALTAQYFGAGQRRDCTGVLIWAGLIALCGGGLLVLLRNPVADLGFFLAGGSQEVQFWGQQYLEIRLLGAPLILLTFVLTGFFRGVADAMSPMWLTIFVNVVNVVADYVLIYGHLGMPPMGVLGAAWASVLSAGAGLVYALFVLGGRYRVYLVERPAHLFDRGKLRLLGTTNFNLFGRTACLLFAQFFMLSQVARMGEVVLAANAVLMQLWSLVSYFVDGIAHSAETLVGNALGARDYTEARQVSRYCLWWGAGVSLGYTLVYILAIPEIARLFTNHENVQEVVMGLIFWVAIILPLNGAVFILDGILNGANDTQFLFGAMAVASFGVFLPGFVFFVHGLDLGLQGAWMGLNCLMVGRFVTLYYRYRSNEWLRTMVSV